MTETLIAKTTHPLAFRGGRRTITAPAGTAVRVEQYGDAALLVLDEWVDGRDYAADWFCTDADLTDVTPR